MFKTLANAWKIKDLKSKLLVTLLIVLLYRIGVAITVPFVDAENVSYVLQNQFGTNGGILNFMNTLSGDALANASLFALGVQPYITASIVIQLLTVAIPALERLSKQGEEGKQKITVITRYITIAIAIIMAIGYYFLLRYPQNGINIIPVENQTWYIAVVMIACYCAGAALVMWLAEKINESGIGNGISIILFANIVSRGSAIFMEYIQKVQYIIDGNPYGINEESMNDIWTQIMLQIYPAMAEEVANPWKYRIPAILVLVLTTVGILALIWFVVHISDSERRIPVQYAKKVVGRKMYGGRNTNLPIKVNMTGVMPVIFANSIITLPGMIFGFITTNPDTFWGKVDAFFTNTSSWFFIALTFILIFAFAYFYVAISFNPVEVAANLQQNGGVVPGRRPGKQTAAYIKKVLSYVTFIGALALSVIAVLPNVVYALLNLIGTKANLPGLTGNYAMISDFAQAGTSIIIVVGVVLEVVRDLEAQMTMRHYKGFLD